MFAEGVIGEEYGLSTNAFAFVQGQVVEKLEQNILKSKNAEDALLKNEEVAFRGVLGYLCKRFKSLLVVGVQVLDNNILL